MQEESVKNLISTPSSPVHTANFPVDFLIFPDRDKNIQLQKGQYKAGKSGYKHR